MLTGLMIENKHILLLGNMYRGADHVPENILAAGGTKITKRQAGETV